MTYPVKRVHLIAICGMGMGSLAGLLKARGCVVTGSDQNIYPPMSDQIASLQIPVKVGFSPDNLFPRPDLVVVGNAVSRNNPEVEATLKNKIPYLSMPQAVDQFFLRDRISVVVAGTHGKTTTSGLLAWLLERTGCAPGFLVGGVLNNFGRSYQLGSGRHFVVEGDEYDTAFFDKGPKFLHYHPQVLILNPIEFDHADIYRDLPQMMTAFERLVSSLDPGCLVIAHAQNSNVRSLLPRLSCRAITFGFSPDAEVGADQLQLSPTTRFRLLYKGKGLQPKPQGEITSPLMGRHNAENLLALIALFLEWGKPLKELQAALTEFKGVKRRQEILGIHEGITLIDDFAHHPTAIRETLQAIRGRYPQSRLVALFEPRSNTTRRSIFQNDFPAAFEAADRVFLGPVYLPEKIPPSERLDLAKLVEELERRGKSARSFDSIDTLAETAAREAIPGDVYCLMSNGSFGNLSQKLLAHWSGREG